MRNLLALVLFSALLLTALPAFAADSPAMPDMSKLGPLSQKIMAAYGAYLKGDIDSLVGMTSDDVDWGGVGPDSFGPPFGSFKGHDGVRMWFAGLAAASEPYKLTNLSFHEDKDSVFVSGDQSTVFKKTGLLAASPFIHAFKFSHGKISWFRVYLDSAGLVAAAGGSAGGMTSGMAGGMRSGEAGMLTPTSAMADGSGMAGGMDMGAQNIARVQAAYQAFGAGDLDKLMSQITDDVTWDSVGPADALPVFGQFSGKAAVRKWFEDLSALMDVKPFTNVRFFTSGDTVVVLGDQSATFKATGKMVNCPFSHVFRFRDGKVYAWQGLEDTAADVMAAH